MNDEKTQLERMAMQVEMLRLAKPAKTITDEEFQHITLRAEDLLKLLNLDDAGMPPGWIKT